MIRPTRSTAALLLGAALLAACADSTAPARPTLAPTAPARTISDATHGGGIAGFYLLPPLVTSAGTFTGTFDPSVSATARVCTPVPACDVTVASFAVGATGAAAITVDPTRQWYAATWAAPASLPTGGGTYRLEVLAGGARLGFADLYVVTSPTALRTVPAGYAGVVRGAPLAIRFRIETGTVVAPTPPAAQGDGYVAFTGQTLIVGAASGLLVNDAPGTPAATVASFGGGSLGGAVTDHAAGSTVALGSGSLAVNADGTLSFTPPTGFAGTLSFQYRVANAAGTSDATVTVTVMRAPTAVRDAFTAPVGGGSLVIAAPGVLANDDIGAPAASVVAFGGGTLGGGVTTNAPGTTVSDGVGGLLRVDANGGITHAPAAGFSGTVTFQYRIANAGGFSDATVTITVPRPPSAVADAYVSDPAGSLLVSAPGLLANDALGTPGAVLTAFGGGSLGGSVTDHAGGTSTAVGSGTLTVRADGSMAFQAPSGFAGTFTFQYLVANAVGSSVGTVTITVPRAPHAFDDGPAPNSGPGALYHVPVNTTLSIPAGAAGWILGNDDRGVPQATVVSFGAGSVGGSVNDYPAGASAASAAGVVTIASDGGLLFTPATGFVGQFTVAYRIANLVGSSTAFVTIAVGQ